MRGESLQGRRGIAHPGPDSNGASKKEAGTVIMKFAVFMLLAAAGCSTERLNSAAYESMRYISNQENALNPQYDPDRIEDYGTYKARREHYLKEKQE